MTDVSTATQPTDPLCWICKTNVADSGEHKTKRSDLLAVIGTPTKDIPFYYHDIGDQYLLSGVKQRSSSADVIQQPS